MSRSSVCCRYLPLVNPTLITLRGHVPWYLSCVYPRPCNISPCNIRCLTTNKEKVESVEERSRLDQHSHGVESSVNVRRLYMQSGTSDILLHICYLLRVKGISGFLSAQGQGLSRETCLCCLSQSLYGNRSCCPLLGPPNLPLPPLPQSASQVP